MSAMSKKRKLEADFLAQPPNASRHPRAEPPWSQGRTTAACGPEEHNALLQSAQRETSRDERRLIGQSDAAESLPRLTAVCDLSRHAESTPRVP